MSSISNVKKLYSGAIPLPKKIDIGDKIVDVDKFLGTQIKLALKVLCNY